MMVRITAVLLFFIHLSIVSHAQTTDYQINRIIPASPTSAALGRYGDIPVNLFNGTPSIDIPLYQLTTPNHNLEIGIAYNASGTRVNEDASWVGLGWSLMAGGVITRTIRQKDDLISGYHVNPQFPNTVDWETRLSFFDNMFVGLGDGEPDIFSYNFCGKAGRFVMGKSSDGGLVFQDSKNNLKIEYIYSSYWTVTDDQGYKYYFSTQEAALNYSASLDHSVTDFDGLTYHDGLGYTPLQPDNQSSVTAWYLDSIVSQTGEILKFTYVKGSSLSTPSVSENRYRTLGVESIECTNAALLPTEPMDMYSFAYSRQTMQNVYLKKIECLNGWIEFKLAGRLDIEPLPAPYSDSIGPCRLEEVIVKNNNGSKIKSFIFYHSYFNSPDKQGRLKLDSIVETGRSGERRPPHKFTYFSPDELPTKNTYSIDHWGYENGAYNKNIGAYSFVTNPFGQLLADEPYGNRGAEEVVNYPIRGVLSQIIYPTGGSSDFDYELHEFASLSGDMAYKTLHKDTMAYNNPQNPSNEPYREVDFTVPAISGFPKIPMKIECRYQNIDSINGNLPDSGQGGSVFVQLKLLDEADNVVDVVYTYSTDQIHELVGMHRGDKSVVPGKYRISVSSSTTWNYKLEVGWIERITVNTRRGGGIRIKSIKSDDGLG